MSLLRDKEFQISYRSDSDNLIADFYEKCMMSSTTYQRAVGYFTSNSLALAAKGLQSFIERGGKMQLVASPVLEKEDIEAIQLGYATREDVLEESLLRQLHGQEDEIVSERLNVLAWLIANEQLDIKVAVFKPDEQPGIYHEKIGLFKDSEGNCVAFTGSANETVGGLYSNFESIDVYCSWREGDRARVDVKKANFELLWSNETKKVEVYDFPEAVKERILEFRRPSYSSVDPELRESTVIREVADDNETCRIPNWVELRDYQREAIANWLEAQGTGILEMATGTGKTFTALGAAAALYEGLGGIGLVIVCPYKHLVDQWYKDAVSFGLKPILGYESRARWERPLNSRIMAFNMGAIPSFCLITTNATFITETMQDTIRRVKRPSLIIFDEAHHVGAQIFRSKLPLNFSFRLALSATPRRWYDDDGNAALDDYFKTGVVFSYGLKEAIGQFLTPYYYHPCIVELTEDENVEYMELSLRISKAYSFNSTEDITQDNSLLRNLLIKRARLISRAENKLNCLKQLLKGQEKANHNLFYCGDSRFNDQRQIELVTRMLGKELRMKVHTFTAEESNEERRRLLTEFERGDLQGLVAIRCLDEGVDVPATKTAYILASSTNPREFIQRRGRVLRRYPGKEFSTIYDFIVVPSGSFGSVDDNAFNTERKLVAREMQRFKEFADLAINGPQAAAQLLTVQKRYNLLDI